MKKVRLRNGKLRINFCNLRMDDESGLHGLFSSQVTEQ